jgi:hypothetical protein
MEGLCNKSAPFPEGVHGEPYGGGLPSLACCLVNCNYCYFVGRPFSADSLSTVCGKVRGMIRKLDKPKRGMCAGKFDLQAIISYVFLF